MGWTLDLAAARIERVTADGGAVGTWTDDEGSSYVRDVTIQNMTQIAIGAGAGIRADYHGFTCSLPAGLTSPWFHVTGSHHSLRNVWIIGLSTVARFVQLSCDDSLLSDWKVEAYQEAVWLDGANRNILRGFHLETQSGGVTNTRDALTLVDSDDNLILGVLARSPGATVYRYAVNVSDALSSGNLICAIQAVGAGTGDLSDSGTGTKLCGSGGASGLPAASDEGDEAVYARPSGNPAGSLGWVAVNARPLHVAMFGGVGSYSAADADDNAIALQMAINQAKTALGGPGEVLIPGGYYVSDILAQNTAGGTTARTTAYGSDVLSYHNNINTSGYSSLINLWGGITLTGVRGERRTGRTAPKTNIMFEPASADATLIGILVVSGSPSTGPQSAADVSAGVIGIELAGQSKVGNLLHYAQPTDAENVLERVSFSSSMENCLHFDARTTNFVGRDLRADSWGGYLVRHGDDWLGLSSTDQGGLPRNLDLSFITIDFKPNAYLDSLGRGSKGIMFIDGRASTSASNIAYIRFSCPRLEVNNDGAFIYGPEALWGDTYGSLFQLGVYEPLDRTQIFFHLYDTYFQTAQRGLNVFRLISSADTGPTYPSNVSKVAIQRSGYTAGGYDGKFILNADTTFEALPAGWSDTPSLDYIAWMGDQAWAGYSTAASASKGVYLS